MVTTRLSSRQITDEPFAATAKFLLKMLRDKRIDLEAGQWPGEAEGRILVAEIRLLREIVTEMQTLSNSNFGEEDL